MANSSAERLKACSEYIKLLKRNEELLPEEVALARESFNEGWQQAELLLNAQNINVNVNADPDHPHL